MHNDAAPFYEDLELSIGAVLIDNGTKFCGTPEHPYRLYLALSYMKHRTMKVRSPRPTALSNASSAR